MPTEKKMPAGERPFIRIIPAEIGSNVPKSPMAPEISSLLILKGFSILYVSNVQSLLLMVCRTCGFTIIKMRAYGKLERTFFPGSERLSHSNGYEIVIVRDYKE